MISLRIRDPIDRFSFRKTAFNHSPYSPPNATPLVFVRIGTHPVVRRLDASAKSPEFAHPPWDSASGNCTTLGGPFCTVPSAECVVSIPGIVAYTLLHCWHCDCVLRVTLFSYCSFSPLAVYQRYAHDIISVLVTMYPLYLLLCWESQSIQHRTECN